MLARAVCIAALALSCMAACCTSLRAQTFIEVQAGENFGNWTKGGTLYPGTVWSTHHGFIAGAAVSLPVSKAWRFAPGVRWVQKGNVADWADIHSDLTLTYLEIAAQMRGLLLDSSVPVSLIGGLAWGTLLSARVDIAAPGGTQNGVDVRGDYRNSDVSIDVGMEVRLPLTGRFALTATAMYSFGVIRISSRDFPSQSKDARVMLGGAYALH